MRTMRNAVFLPLAFILFSSAVFAQENKHIVSIASGFGLSIDNSLYIDFDDPDFEIWSEPSNNLTFTAAYEYKLNEYVRIGGQVEYEKVNFESYYTGEASANRTAFGLTTYSQFPKKNLHMEFGGFINLAMASSEEFDNSISGIEYGLITGPAYDLNNFSLAIFIKPQFSYFFSKDEAPASALLMYPRLLLRVGYSF